MGKETNAGLFNVRKCATCGKEIVAPHTVMHESPFTLYVNYRKVYCCGWKCFREYKYQLIMKKKKKTLEDLNWLKFARFE